MPPLLAFDFHCRWRMLTVHAHAHAMLCHSTAHKIKSPVKKSNLFYLIPLLFNLIYHQKEIMLSLPFEIKQAFFDRLFRCKGGLFVDISFFDKGHVLEHFLICLRPHLVLLFSFFL